VPGHQPRLDGLQLCLQHGELACQQVEHLARQDWYSRLGGGDAIEQRRHLFRPLGRGHPKLRGMTTDGVDQHRALLDQEIAYPCSGQGQAFEQHQRGLALGALDRHKPHPRTAHRLADRRGIDRIVLAALDVEPAPAKAGGLMYCGGISTASCPKPRNTRAQWCAAPHASSAIRVGASLAKNLSTSPRRSCRRNTGCSFSSTP
jgi:hypothetical protein